MPEYRLVDVYADLGAIQFLWDLLKERDFDSVTLSHRIMPSKAQHIAFVMSKPYKHWWIIFNEERRVGSLYLTHRNEIGIFIAKDSQRLGIGTWALQELGARAPSVEEFYANINPKNYPSRDLFRKLGFREYQITVRYRRDGNYGSVLPRFESGLHERSEANEAAPAAWSGEPPCGGKTFAAQQREVHEGGADDGGSGPVAYTGL